MAASKETRRDAAIARSFVYRFLARAFDYPDPAGWGWLSAAGTRDTLRKAVQESHPGADGLATAAALLVAELERGTFESFEMQHLGIFGHTVRGDCPAHELEYGDLKADPMFQLHRIADLSAFYRAFGLSLSEDASERQDHLSIECEFMSVLTAKEAYAAVQDDTEAIEIIQDGQRKFLREHLGRWTPAFARRLARAAGGSITGRLADCLKDWMLAECGSLGIPSGSEDLILRPVNEETETFTGSCGLGANLPGACAVPEGS